MGDITDDKKASLTTRLVGEDEEYAVQVELIDGQPSLRTFGIQAIESLRGFDPIPDVWFYIGTELDSSGAGNIGDEVRIQIAASTDNPTDFPAIDETYTLVAEDVGDEEVLATNIAAFLNSTSPFSTLWRAQRLTNSGGIYISSRKPGGQFERPNTNDFQVTSTGTTVATIAFDNIIRRNKVTSLARDPADPRQGILGIQGSVIQTEGDITNRFQIVFDTLNVNGSGTPVDFTIDADVTDVKFISKVIISGRDNGIQFSNFLGQNSELTNGIVVSFKTNDIMITRAPIKTTDDFLDLHAEDPDNFVVYFASGDDKFTAVLEFGSPLELRPQGEFPTNDYLTITINDNLNNINQLRAIVDGFTREF